MMIDAQRLNVAKARAKELLAHLDGVEGIGIGDKVILVYVRSEAVAAKIPDTIYNVPVKVNMVGDIEAWY
jgi:hypothetical protein